MPVEDLTKFELKSDAGKVVRYVCAPHPAGEGFNLLPKVVKILGGAVGDFMGASGADVLGEGGSVSLSTVFGSNIEWSKLGPVLGTAITRAADQIVSFGGDAFMRDILKHTTRQLAEPNSPELRCSEMFEAMYQANYGELFAAVAKVLEVNFGPLLKGRLGAIAASAKKTTA